MRAPPAGARHRTRNARRTSRASRDLWDDCRTRFGADGPWLFGEYSVADAMYAPVVLRLRTYGAQRARQRTADYMATVLADAHMRDWLAAAAAESWTIEASEIGDRQTLNDLEIVMKSWLRIAMRSRADSALHRGRGRSGHAPSRPPT